MGLTLDSTGTHACDKGLKGRKNSGGHGTVALAGNPNVGKSTVFNELTGMNQHTGNWPGKTVCSAEGHCTHNGHDYILVDIPGSYSLMAHSAEEEVARDFICFGGADAVIVVCDATCLERNMNLVLQTIEITSNVVVCVNLMDEAEKKKIRIDLAGLERKLGVPVIAASARSGKGLTELMNRTEELLGSSVHRNNENKDGIPRNAENGDGIHCNTENEDRVHCNAENEDDIHHNTKHGDGIFIRYPDAVEDAIRSVQEEIDPVLKGKINTRWVALKLLDGDSSLLTSLEEHLDFRLADHLNVSDRLVEARGALSHQGLTQEKLRDTVVSRIYQEAESICSNTVQFENKKYNSKQLKLDRILTSRFTGVPIMLLLLAFVFWITITGANVPSQILADGLFYVQDRLTQLFHFIHAPEWLHGILVLGLFRVLAWVISVMLPPMAIFFPLFTLLEDAGYLPRIAFNLDHQFKKCCACGKQALTMCMGFGCNAAGIIGCRIIDSPRERLIAILTNNFVPCNGRFPTLIAIITMFFVGTGSFLSGSILSTLLLTGVIVLGVVMTLLVSRILSGTLLKGVPSSFTLELPPYRRPQIGKVIVRSIFDRTLFVLARAIIVAAPAGVIIWILANIQVGNVSILDHCTGFLDPFAHLLGMDGVILMAFILGLPANEIVVPIIIMAYLSTGSILELDDLTQMHDLFVAHGWTWLTAVCTMLFSLMHWPCSTTLLTIQKETQSWKWCGAAFLIPSACGLIICFIVAQSAQLLGLV